jgi:alginate production protein
MRTAASTLAFGSLAALASNPAEALQLDYRIKAVTAVVADRGQDFGLQQQSNTTQAYLDLTPWAHFRFTPQWGAFVRARLFAPTGNLQTQGNENNNVNSSSRSFVGLKEAWIEYAGLTSYPGESFRVGRQRILQDDTQWWDEEIDAVRWIFDTTLLEAQLGAARNFDTYRTDSQPLPVQEKNRLYGFATVAGEWRARQRIGARVIHASDSKDPPAPGAAVDSATKVQDAELTWAGLFADDHYFDWQDQPSFAYWESVSWLFGDQRTAIVDATHTVTGEQSGNVHAWAAEADLRYRLPFENFPLQIGGGYVYSSGGTALDPSHQYQQSGTQSNYSRFTGTRSLINRFNEAYRAELGNIKVASGFISLNRLKYDLSVVYSHFEKTHGDAPVVTDGIVVSPTNGSSDLGDGVDFVAAYYFGQNPGESKYALNEDVQPTIRLRTSWFRPGSAYDPGWDDRYRVFLEFSLWY